MKNFLFSLMALLSSHAMATAIDCPVFENKKLNVSYKPVSPGVDLYEVTVKAEAEYSGETLKEIALVKRNNDAIIPVHATLENGLYTSRFQLSGGEMGTYTVWAEYSSMHPDCSNVRNYSLSYPEKP